METYLKIKDTLYPAVFRGRMQDQEWNGRNSIAATMEMTYAEAAARFVDGLEWSLVQQMDTDSGQQEMLVTDYSDYCVAGPITDNRNGTVTVKLGKITAEEALAELMEVLT